MSRRATAGALAAGALIAVPAAGCESTQSKSARLAREGKAAERPAARFQVRRTSRVVEVAYKTVLSDANGAAVVLGLRNTSGRALAEVPVSIAVRDGSGRTVFQNDAPGLERSLVSAARLPAGKTVDWVNDQVLGSSRPRSVAARIGGGRAAAGGAGGLEVSPPKLVDDPVSGAVATGTVRNRTGSLERRVLVTAVARRGGRIVAAGRAQVARVRPGRKARYNVLFIGRPRGARLAVAVSPGGKG